MTRERAAELLSDVTVLDDPEMEEAHKMAISALRQQDVTDTDVGKKMTNADRIRAMTDEELAAVIMCQHQFDGKTDCTEPNCFRCSLKWLQQPSEEADNV